MQIKLLRILARIGADDQSASESMYEVLRDCLRRADIQSSAAYGTLTTCVCAMQPRSSRCHCRLPSQSPQRCFACWATHIAIPDPGLATMVSAMQLLSTNVCAQ